MVFRVDVETNNFIFELIINIIDSFCLEKLQQGTVALKFKML